MVDKRADGRRSDPVSIDNWGLPCCFKRPLCLMMMMMMMTMSVAHDNDVASVQS